MLSELEANEILYQESAVAELLEKEDPNLAFYDDHGSARIGLKVLQAFNKLTPDVIYSRSGRYWRHREDHDEPGRQQY
jgi:hypothetical protein